MARVDEKELIPAVIPTHPGHQAVQKEFRKGSKKPYRFPLSREKHALYLMAGSMVTLDPA